MRLLAGGLLPTTAYGCSAQAWAASELERWRSAVGNLTFGSARGRSLQVGFALSAAPWRDPWCSQAEQALLAWGRGLAQAHPDTTRDMVWV